MHTIQTTYKGPTNSRGSRILAKTPAGRISLSYSHDLNSDRNHSAAAEALARKLGWSGRWIMVGCPSEDGYIFASVWDGQPALVISA